VNAPRRGEIYVAYTKAAGGRSHSGTRPVVIVSSDTFNAEPFEIVHVVPCTTTDWDTPLHVPIDPPEAGVLKRTYAMCDHLMPLRRKMLIKPWQSVAAPTMQQIDHRLRVVLDLI